MAAGPSLQTLFMRRPNMLHCANSVRQTGPLNVLASSLRSYSMRLSEPSGAKLAETVKKGPDGQTKWIKFKSPMKTSKSLLRVIQEEEMAKLRKTLPLFNTKFQIGDTITVRFREGDEGVKEAEFTGVVIAIRNKFLGSNFQVLSMTTGTCVTFPAYYPKISSVTIVNRPEKRPRRAKLYYMWRDSKDIMEEEGGD